MVEFTPELVAILAYTAFALFLSLYFVPFKVVPKAWAKAVRTKGHPAQVALTAVLEEAAPLVAKGVQLPDLKKLEATAEALMKWATMVTPVINSLQAEPLKALVNEAISNHTRAAKAREGIGDGEITEADLGVIQAAGSIAEHPEQAQLAATLINTIEVGIDAGMIKEKAGLKTIGKIQDALEAGRDLSAIRQRLAKMYPTLAAGGQGAPKGGQRGSGFNPG